MVEFRNIIEDIYILETPFAGVWSGIVLIMGDKKILIDSGGEAEVIDNYLIPALDKLGIKLSDIDLLLNTHCHGDHVGGHYRIRQLSNIRIACYEKSLDKIRNPIKYSMLIREEFPEESPSPPSVLLGVEPDILVKENELIEGRLRLIATPGHDDDTICWYDIKTKSLICGDSLQGNGTDSQGIALYMDLDAYRTTLINLMKMDIENIITAHPYIITGDKAIGRDKTEQFIKKCYDITKIYDAYIQGAIETGESCKAVIARRLIKYMKGKMPDKLFLAMYTVTSHIKQDIGGYYE